MMKMENGNGKKENKNKTREYGTQEIWNLEIRNAKIKTDFPNANGEQCVFPNANGQGPRG
jgi:hypothetical protein